MKKPQHLTVMVHETGKPTIDVTSELAEACNWALEQFQRLADEGRYPEFMLSNNGGEGVMPLVNALKKAGYTE